MDTDRPTLTAEDRAILRRFGDNGYPSGGRFYTVREILDAWADAEDRAMHATATPDLSARISAFLETNLPTDSGTLRTAVGTLRAQEAKGRGKYGADLDGAGLSALQLLTHATEEAADLLMYLTALRERVKTLETIDRHYTVTDSEYDYVRGERDTLAARVAALEAELSATERTADAERERAKRAERLLESESARVAELEAENERLRDIGEDLCINMGAFIGAHECPSQEVIRRWDTATGQDNAGSNLRAYSADCAGPAPNSAEPTTRPLTTADRFPMVGDVLVCPVGGTLACVQAGTEYKFVVNDDLDGYVWRDSNHLQHTRPHEYISRADGGPVVMGGADGG